MIRCVYRVIYLMYSYVVTIVPWLLAYLVAIVLSVNGGRKEIIYNSVSRFTARLNTRLLGLRITIYGIDNIPDEPVIFVSNHQSFYDIILALACIPDNFSFISKESVFSVPVVGRFMKTAGHISLKRESGKKAYETMSQTIDKLGEGKSLVLFPEGTRSVDGSLGPFKRGVSLVVLSSGMRVVPVAIKGSGKFFPRDGMVCDPYHREVSFAFGKPLEFAKLTKTSREDVNNVVETLRGAVSALLDQPGA